ncbi:hypothetical protein J3L12_16485, partial [Meiothermus sp. CFH 77666]|nr:hypothetical protein [Meiothermus sp. CFH 77666]
PTPRPRRLRRWGHYLLALRENQAVLKDWGEFVLRYPAEEVHRYHEVRSGVLWVWQARRTTQLPPEEEVSFPGLKQIVAIHRHKMHKRSGAVSQEQANAATLARLSRGHWAIENRLHHKRDVALGEDACGSGCPAQPAPGLPSSKGRPCVAQPPSLRRQSYAPVSVVIGVGVYMIRAWVDNLTPNHNK